MKIAKNILLRTFMTLSVFFSAAAVFAQSGKIGINESDYGNQAVDMADMFRQDGKIYVVVAVLITIFVGMIVFLIQTERRVAKLEKLAADAKHSESNS